MCESDIVLRDHEDLGARATVCGATAAVDCRFRGSNGDIDGDNARRRRRRQRSPTASRAYSVFAKQNDQGIVSAYGVYTGICSQPVFR